MASAGNEILVLRKAIADTLRAALETADVDELPHTVLSTADIAPTLQNRPLALRVAFLGSVSEAELNSNEVDAPLVWAVYVAAKDTAKDPKRDQLVLAILPHIMRIVASADWTAGADEADDVQTGPVKRLRARPLYEGENDTKSACVWVIEWHQTVVLAPPTPDDLRDLLTLITRYDLHPKDGVIDAEDVIDMRHP